MYLCTLCDTVLWIWRPLRRQHCSNRLKTYTRCQATFQHPAVLLCLKNGHLPAIRSCFSRFQCSAMQKINSSGYSTSTQANLNTVSTFIHSLHLVSSSFLSWMRNQDDVSYTPANIHLLRHISSSQSPAHYFICKHALSLLSALCTSTLFTRSPP